MQWKGKVSDTNTSKNNRSARVGIALISTVVAYCTMLNSEIDAYYTKAHNIYSEVYTRAI